MGIGVVTGFTHNDREYEVPTSKSERKRFTAELKRKLNALEGVEDVFNAGTTQTWDGIRLEIALDVEEGGRNSVKLSASPRSLSPRIRNVLKDLTPVSTYEMVFTPEPVNADQNRYDEGLYIAEVRFY